MVWLNIIEELCKLVVPNLANKHIIVNYTIGPNKISESGMRERERERECILKGKFQMSQCDPH